ncbi:MAG: GAF domain-containing protein [Gammaproteobacteria bacterium]|nr:GAF domain-containing protein [Gammaproteobacteria bacterium]
MNKPGIETVPAVSDLFERRLKDSILRRAIEVFPAAARDDLVLQVDDLARRLDALVEATRKVRESLSFDVMLTRLMALITQAFDADRSSLFLYDAETRELVSRIAQGDSLGEIRFPADAGIAGAVFHSGQPAVILNAYADPRFNSAVDAATGYHTHNILCVPLRTRAGDVIGVTEVLNKRSGDFTAADSALLQAFTTHTAIVIESAQLAERARDSQREEARILEVTQAVSSELNIDKLLRKIIGIATDLLDAERSTLFLHDPVTDELWSRVAEGLAEREIRIPAHRGIAGEVFTSREAVVIADAYADPRFNPEVDRHTGYRTRSILCVPVLNKHGIAVGVMQVLNRRGGPFRPRDQRRLEMLAAQSAIALENARLFREVLDERNYSENVLRSLSDAVLTLDNGGNVVKVNEAAVKLLRVRAEQILGASTEKLFGRGNPWLLASVRRVLEGRQPDLGVDQKLLTFDGASVAVNYHATPLADAAGAPLGCTVIIDDITEEKRMRATMARYMTAQVAEQVLAAGESVLGGRSQNVTVLFSDIRGFTGIAEQLGAQETVSLLNEYFTEMVEIVFEHQGILDKYIGDAIMAVFGAPFASPRDADNAVKVAIRMQRALAGFNARRRAQGRAELEVRIGINSGDVVAGNIGSARRMDYTVVGDGVNVAARLESANKQLGTRILISGSTREQLRDYYRLREIDLLQVSGKREPVPVFEVRGHGDDPLAPRELELLDRFARGLAAYRHRAWAMAIGHLDAVLDIDGDDRPAWRLRERARHYARQEPPADWDGVWRLDEK